VKPSKSPKWSYSSPLTLPTQDFDPAGSASNPFVSPSPSSDPGQSADYMAETIVSSLLRLSPVRSSLGESAGANDLTIGWKPKSGSCQS
jgi:hypothetical protein